MERPIRKIVVDVVTSFATGAGTRAPVFLGLGGREFRLTVEESSDFERGGEMSYQCGEDANVAFPDRNDPRTGVPLCVGNLLAHPVYLRLEARSERDDWNVEAVAVRVMIATERRALRYCALEGPHESIWLGVQSGTTLQLHRSALDRGADHPEQDD